MIAVIFNLLVNIQQLTDPSMGFEKAGEGYFSPNSKKISFQAVPIGERDYQIYTLDLETKEICQISHGFKACTCSFFHPDGKRILFAGSPLETKPQIPGKYEWDLTPFMNIYEADLDGGNLTPLTEGAAYHAECAYSPDGTKIVFASNDSGSMNIYTMNRDGSQKRQLTHTDHCYNGGPFFSPDGTKILFRSDRERAHYLQIYLMESDGLNLTQLTKNAYVNWAPFWHPSGRAIAYTTSIHGHHNYQIYLLHLETGETCRVTDSPTFDGLPAFNKEGTKMLWTSKRGEDKSSQLFIAEFQLPEGW